MVMTRRLAPFLYVILGFVGDELFSEKVSSVIWTVGALALAAMYSVGWGRRRSTDPARTAARQERRGR